LRGRASKCSTKEITHDSYSFSEVGYQEPSFGGTKLSSLLTSGLLVDELKAFPFVHLVRRRPVYVRDTLGPK
jgi:hypothetical protein